MNKNPYTTRLVTFGQSTQLQVTRVTLDLSTPRYTQTVHWHDFFELELVIKGRALHLLNGKTTPVGVGSMYLLTPADLHTLLPDPDADDPHIRVINISFSDTIVSEPSFVEVQTLPSPLAATAEGVVLDELIAIAEGLLRLNKSTDPHTEDIQRHLFLSVVFRFLQLYHMQHVAESEPEPKDKLEREMSYVRNAVAYIRYNFRNPTLTVNSIATAVCLSPNYFGTIFKRHIGETCLSYIRKMRLNFAWALLQNSSLTISEIAEKCGYATVPYFISDFREAYGMPPKKHRDNLLKQKAQESDGED